MAGEVTQEALLARLRSISYPGAGRDIVARGFVREVRLEGGLVTVSLAPTTLDAETVRQVMEDIRQEFSRVEGVRKVRIERRHPVSGDQLAPPGRLRTPLQAELLEEGVVPQADEIGAALQRVGVAPDAGYGEAGPDPLPSPESITPQERYSGWPPVFQWEIDPGDASLDSGEASVRLGDWEYEIWFQVHPAGLVYVSIQAMDDDPAAGPERQHPVGRNVVVNLVYDRRRTGVVAIYGTARDFRPFVEAFGIAFGLDRERRQEREEKNS